MDNAGLNGLGRLIMVQSCDGIPKITHIKSSDRLRHVGDGCTEKSTQLVNMVRVGGGGGVLKQQKAKFSSWLTSLKIAKNSLVSKGQVPKSTAKRCS